MKAGRKRAHQTCFDSLVVYKDKHLSSLQNMRPSPFCNYHRNHWVQAPGKKGVACDWPAPGRGSQTGRRLSSVVHVVGGPDVLRGHVLAALLRAEECVLQHPARAAHKTVGCAACESHGQPQLSSPRWPALRHAPPARTAPPRPGGALCRRVDR